MLKRYGGVVNAFDPPWALWREAASETTRSEAAPSEAEAFSPRRGTMRNAMPPSDGRVILIAVSSLFPEIPRLRTTRAVAHAVRILLSTTSRARWEAGLRSAVSSRPLTTPRGEILTRSEGTAKHPTP
jgi:hypothetical protein